MEEQEAGKVAALARAWAKHQHELGTASASAAANRVFDQLAHAIRAVEDTDAGMEALVGLMHDRDPFVRIVGATYLLPRVAEARGVLEAVEREGPPLAKVTARSTLREFDAGRLR